MACSHVKVSGSFLVALLANSVMKCCCWSATRLTMRLDSAVEEREVAEGLVDFQFAIKFGSWLLANQRMADWWVAALTLRS